MSKLVSSMNTSNLMLLKVGLKKWKEKAESEDTSEVQEIEDE